MGVPVCVTVCVVRGCHAPPDTRQSVGEDYILHWDNTFPSVIQCCDALFVIIHTPETDVMPFRFDFWEKAVL